uniref:PLAT domain-containing protein n=1 Tax=Meloidogyne enterolobii TaxID=390850 RepID=A0A6V7WBA3_MELEN|nr:unnamed protein product [Meloidogyne enterolobii]
MENGREDAREDGMEEREEEALDEVVEDMKEEDVEEVNEMDEVTTPPKIEEEAKSPSPVQYTIVHTGGSNPEQENEGGMSGVYSDELERILYGQAAVKIQSVWRGYTVRKGFKHTRFSEHPIYIGTGSYGPRRRSKNNLYKPNERHHAIITRVKTPKSGKRKTSFKKTSTTMLVPDYGNETAHDSSSDREEASVTELLQGKQRLGWEMSQDHIDKSPVNSQRTPRTDYLYTITVLTGNRWAADTEADLYIILVGAGGIESERLWLRQEFTNWLQSGANGQRFRQNHSDSFQFRVPSRFGILKKLTIGHDCKGYGAGIFIDRIMVTEDEEASEDCRQFLFLCNKWLDSGQVDGKLERTIRLSSFYEISSIPIEDRVTRGRWELILHGGSEKGLGGTTSQLSITGYGTRAQSTTSGLYDSNMAKVPSDALIQLDFGDIGELLKVRVEIDGTGSSPDYFLNFVEFKDLDTEERFVVMCGKWLRWKSTKKGDQPFRELSASHIGVEPLPLITYEGKISVQSTPKIECLDNKEVLMDLHGDLGETGIFRVTIAPQIDYKEKQLKSGDEENMPINEDIDKENENIDISFKVEAVSVGRVVGARLRFEPNSIGEQILDGLLAIQGLFQKQGLWPLSSNSEFLCGRILLRESYHTPYRYVLTRSQFHELSEQTQFCTKELLTTEMERNSFEFEAVSIGHLDFAEMEVFCSDVQNFSWECSELIITDTNTALYYKFKFDSPSLKHAVFNVVKLYPLMKQRNNNFL